MLQHEWLSTWKVEQSLYLQSKSDIVVSHVIDSSIFGHVYFFGIICKHWFDFQVFANFQDMLPLYHLYCTRKFNFVKSLPQWGPN